MPALTTPIPDQDDILVTNERLTAENARLTNELAAATELLETAQTQLTTAQAEAAKVPDLTTKVTALTENLERSKAEVTALNIKLGDFNKAVAAEVQKLGLRPKAAEHREAPADTDLSPTQRVLAAKGVGSIRELSPKLNP
jgi:predicted RNase H-like nuclease (RuvC/YqgF family)